MSEQYLRWQRAQTQHFYVIDTLHDPSGKAKIKVNGTKDVYDVTVTPRGRLLCSCPDFALAKRRYNKQICCKHICFVLMRILGYGYAQAESSLDRAFLTESDHDAFLIKLKPRRNELDAETQCPVCFESLTDNPREACRTCGNWIHTECMARWLNFASNTCVYCRSPW